MTLWKQVKLIEINHNLRRHKERIRTLLTSEEGLYHRSKRPIEPESVLGQSKSNKQYNRFRHFDKDKVMMDYGTFAVAFNIGKLYNKGKITLKNGQKPSIFSNFFVFVIIFYAKNELHRRQENFYAENLKLAA
jgi:hypothetical protein